MGSNDQSMSTPQPASDMAGLLSQALRMTERLAGRALEVEEITAVLDERAKLIDLATAARERGEAWGDRETALVSKLTALDAQLVSGVWAERKDSFAWLAERAPDAVADMPLLCELAKG